MTFPLDGGCRTRLALIRVNPDITEDPTTVEAGGTHFDQWKELASDWATAYAAAKLAPGTVRGEIEESMLVTKAMLMKKKH